MRTEAAWAAMETPGLEHVRVSSDSGGWHAGGTVITTDDGLATVRYQVQCDHGWRFRELRISVADASGERALELLAATDGRWRANRQPRPDLDGCIDIDINCTPLTNTLPIRRYGWAIGQARDLDVAYVSVPELSVRKVRQRYTLLTRAGAGDPAGPPASGSRSASALYRYESGEFRADLPVDDNALVLDYPGIWQRVATRPADALA